MLATNEYILIKIKEYLTILVFNIILILSQIYSNKRFQVFKYIVHIFAISSICTRSYDIHTSFHSLTNNINQLIFLPYHCL